MDTPNEARIAINLPPLPGRLHAKRNCPPCPQVLLAMGLVVSLGTICSSCQSLAASVKERPALVANATAYDFGTVRQGTFFQHQFRITNVGRRPYDIIRVSGCCSLEADLEGSTHIQPGQSRTVRLGMSSTYRPVRLTRDAVVETNDPLQPRIRLTVSLNVAPKLTAIPESLDGGELRRGDEQDRSLDLWNIPRGFRITSLTANSPALHAEQVRLPATAAYVRIRVRFRSALAPPGELRAEVRVRTNDATFPSLVIPARATILDEYGIDPPVLALGIVGSHSTAPAQASILARSPNAPAPRLALSAMPGYRVKLFRPARGAAYILTVSPKGHMRPGRVHDAIELRAGHRTLRVPITGYVDPSLDR